MPLERGLPIGYDAKSMVFRFSMTNGSSNAVLCEVSRTAMDGIEKRRAYSAAPDRLVQFLRIRDRIEAAASSLWDSGGVSPDNKLRLFRKHFRSR
jgi:hypothetical protein